MTRFAPGDRVHVAGLGTGVVREARNGGLYLIELKGHAVVVAGGQLERAGPSRIRGRTAPVDEAVPPAHATTASTRPSPSLDLHGKTALEAVDALDAFLNDAILEGVDEVRVIHGRSGGTLKAAVYQRLAQLPTVRAFRVDPGNPGVTVVRL